MLYVKVPFAGTLATLAVLFTVGWGALTGVVTVPEQRAAAGQVLSPPPLAVAVFVTEGVAASVGVTGHEARAAASSQPAATVQVTVCPAAVQPRQVPMVKPFGMVSVVWSLPSSPPCRVAQLRRVAGCNPPPNVGVLAVLFTVGCGAFSGVVVVELQRSYRTTRITTAVAVAVFTRITSPLVSASPESPNSPCRSPARPAAIVHVTVCQRPYWPAGGANGQTTRNSVCNRGRRRGRRIPSVLHRQRVAVRYPTTRGNYPPSSSR